MVRGVFTAASGMMAQQDNMSVIANNLANVDKTAYKRQLTLFKSFPEMLMRRVNDDGVVHIPLGSYDIGPVVGKMGTGVEVNHIATIHEQGYGLKQTGNDFDFALEGKGFFTVLTPEGERYTRNGSFLLDSEGYLVTKDGFKVLGLNGPIRVQANNFYADEFGRIWINSTFNNSRETMVDRESNGWENTKLLDEFKLVNFYDDRELTRVGNSFYAETRYSGPAIVLSATGGRPKVHQGFLEASNVNPVLEMVRMIEVQRAYEANQKMITTQDALLDRVVNQVGRGI